MGQKTSGNEHLYKDIVGELEKSFTYLDDLITKNKSTISNASRIDTLVGKDLQKFEKGMGELVNGVSLFNSGLDNVIMFIRSGDIGELEDVAIYLEKCGIKDVSGNLLSGKSEAQEIKEFQQSLNRSTVFGMLSAINDIASADHNTEFLKLLNGTKLLAA